MKKTLLITGIIMNLSLWAQTPKKTDRDSVLKFTIKTIVDDSFKELAHEIDSISKDKDIILTGKAFNLLAAQTMSSYLSSSSDLSLNKAYGVLDNTDGKVYIGGNIPLRKKSGKIGGLITLGAKANITDKIAELFSDEKIANEISGEFKFTWLMFHNVKFIGGSQAKKINEQRDNMSLMRSRILQEHKLKAGKELTDLIKSLEGMNNTDSVKILSEKIKSMEEDIAADFYKEEEALFEKSPSKYSNSQKLMWFSLLSSIPVSETKYSIAENYKTTPRSVYYYPMNASAKLTFLHNYYKYFKYFANVSYTYGKSNTLLDSAIDQSTITKTIKLDTSSVINSTSKAYYSPSGFRQYGSDKLRGQLIIYPDPTRNKYIGLDVFADLRLDNGDATWGFGIPVSLRDSDDKPLVNFELIVNKVNQPENRTVGLSLSLPFSSVID